MFGTLRKTNNSANLYGTDNKKKLETIQPASLRTPAMPKKNAAEIGGDTSIFGKKLAGLKSRRPKEFAEAITQTDEEITHFAEGVWVVKESATRHGARKEVFLVYFKRSLTNPSPHNTSPKKKTKSPKSPYSPINQSPLTLTKLKN